MQKGKFWKIMTVYDFIGENSNVYKTYNDSIITLLL